MNSDVSGTPFSIQTGSLLSINALFKVKQSRYRSEVAQRIPGS
jgi:hypothetical protein